MLTHRHLERQFIQKLCIDKLKTVRNNLNNLKSVEKLIKFELNLKNLLQVKLLLKSCLVSKIDGIRGKIRTKTRLINKSHNVKKKKNLEIPEMTFEDIYKKMCNTSSFQLIKACLMQKLQKLKIKNQIKLIQFKKLILVETLKLNKKLVEDKLKMKSQMLLIYSR